MTDDDDVDDPAPAVGCCSTPVLVPVLVLAAAISGRLFV